MTEAEWIGSSQRIARTTIEIKDKTIVVSTVVRCVGRDMIQGRFIGIETKIFGGNNDGVTAMVSIQGYGGQSKAVYDHHGNMIMSVFKENY